MSQKLIDAIADMREDDALKISREMVASGTDPLDVLEACQSSDGSHRPALRDRAIYFLPELMLAGEMMNQITDMVKSELAKSPAIKRRGKVLIGTVAGRHSRHWQEHCHLYARCQRLRCP